MLLPEDQEKTMHSWCTFLKNFQEMNQSMASSYFEGMNKQMPISPTLIGDVFIKAAQSLLKKPSVLMEAQEELLKEMNGLWQKMVFPEQDTAPENIADKRFHHEAWDNIPYFLFMKEYYLMTSRWLKNLMSEVEGIDELSKKKLQFYTNQLIEAVSPTNFPFTNPEVLEEMVKTDGSSLKKGFETLVEDMSSGQWMKMTDPTAFKLGKTIATTKGDVVFRNELFELIHYHPLTEKQCSVPLLIIPPWINKFYIFDLSPKNSFVKWMLEQGQNVFIISWVNPESTLGSKTFEDYLLEGAYQACEFVSTFTESPSLHTMGYCIGGNMLTALSAYLAKTSAPFSLQTMTLLATIIDFTKIGDLKLFMDEECLQWLEDTMNQKGFLEAERLKSIFSMLRPNELIWSFFIKNYLLGQIPPAFDFLYWNSDSTRLPATLHREILRDWFQKNLLMMPGGMTIKGIPLDVRNITTPAMFLSTIDDHISPWKSSYTAVHLLKGPLKFVLAGSGHVAGVMNPPERNKYGFFTNSSFPYSPEEWFETAEKTEGSWWPLWQEWMQSFGGHMMVPPVDCPSLGPAPGIYVSAK